ncbi:MAG: flavoprotein [Pseudomonadota bacterium]
MNNEEITDIVTAVLSQGARPGVLFPGRVELTALVTAVLNRLAPLLGADGRRGSIVAVFTGASAGLPQAIEAARGLVFDGFKLKIAYSTAGRQFMEQTLARELAGLPQVEEVNPEHWFSDLLEARAVIAPLLSVNTLSKVALLLADNLASNLILQALFMGKPVALALDGVAYSNPARGALGLNRATPALQQALRERLDAVKAFGARLVDIEHLRATVNDSLLGQADVPRPAKIQEASPAGPAPIIGVVTTIEVENAARQGAALRVRRGAVITPLARELAQRRRVEIVED